MSNANHLIVILAKQIYNSPVAAESSAVFIILMEVIILDDLLEKLKEYLKMDEEISYDEFSDFYNKLVTELNQSFDALDQDARIKALYICSVVQANAESRIKESKATAKSFKKMGAKCNFWKDAIKFHLGKSGMTSQEIEQATEKVSI